MKKFYIADMGEYGQGDAVSLYISKRGNVLAEYTQEPHYFDTEEQAQEMLDDVQNRAWDYSFSVTKYIREREIKPENLEIVEVDFDEE
jgi:hypothetical protein|nr:MAG TPA: hypothetical protein [Caudoviricetes sp.]DAM80471.1 MAG TPA: hypothetical protein [Caudoviricetes sp.]